MSSRTVAPGKLAHAMEEEMQQYLTSAMAAVNGAPDGEWIAGGDERVQELSAECLNRPCGWGSMRRKPLFRRPREVETGKRLANQGRQATSVLTINGRTHVRRRW